MLQRLLVYCILLSGVVPCLCNPGGEEETEQQKHDTTTKKPMVIGLGPGRTGTDSLRQALVELGFGPTYHMKELTSEESGVSTEGHQQMFVDAAHGKSVDFREMLKGFNSGVDFPLSVFAEELLEVFPDAKFVLTKRRDAKTWYKSIDSSICKLSSRRYPVKLLQYLPIGLPFSRWKNHAPVLDAMIKYKFAPGIASSWMDLCNSPDKATTALEQWNEKVERIIPPEQLLVFEVGVHGYHELCQFLNVPEPGLPYPRVNSKTHVQDRLRLLWAIFFFALLAIVGVPTTILYLLIGGRRKMNRRIADDKNGFTSQKEE